MIPSDTEFMNIGRLAFDGYYTKYDTQRHEYMGYDPDGKIIAASWSMLLTWDLISHHDHVMSEECNSGK